MTTPEIGRHFGFTKQALSLASGGDGTVEIAAASRELGLAQGEALPKWDSRGSWEGLRERLRALDEIVCGSHAGRRRLEDFGRYVGRGSVGGHGKPAAAGE
jgi:hypothetical protein